MILQMYIAPTIAIVIVLLLIMIIILMVVGFVRLSRRKNDRHAVTVDNAAYPNPVYYNNQGV